MEDFVSFEIAKKLEEKGFKEKCLTYYDVNDNVELLYNTQYTDYMLPCQYTDLLQCHNTGEAEIQPDDSDFCVDAPTISQVLKWLRKEKKIHINIGIYPNGWKFYCCSCEKHNNGKFGDYDICEPLGLYNSYEAAAIAGIEYVINNLI